MKIKHKLLLSIAGLSFIIVTMFIMTWHTTSSQKDDGLVINLAGRQRMLIQKMTKEVLLYKQNTNPAAAEKMRDQVKETVKVFDITLNALKESGTAPLTLDSHGPNRQCPRAEEPAYSQLDLVKKHWTVFKEKISSGLKDPNDIEAFQYINKNNMPLLAEMNKAVGMMQKQSEAKVDILLTKQIAGIIIGLIFSILAFLVVNSFIKKLELVSHFSEAIGNGDFTFTVSETDNNELGEILNQLNHTVEKIAHVLKPLKTRSGNLKSTSERLHLISSDLMSSSGKMKERAQSVAAASEEMSVNMNSVSSAVQQVGSNIDVISTSSQNLSSTVGEIAQNAETARSVTANAVASVADASLKVNELGASADEIGNVIETINEIAEQTKLLALNATIEAARAGEAGKGFAVVANEVKELAAQTNKATEDIRNKIESMQGSAKGTIDEINGITSIIQNVSDIVNSIATSVEEQSLATQGISANISETTLATKDMSVNVEQSAQASNMIANDVSEVNQTSNDVNRISSQVDQDAQALKSISEEIEQMIDAFKV